MKRLILLFAFALFISGCSKDEKDGNGILEFRTDGRRTVAVYDASLPEKGVPIYRETTEGFSLSLKNGEYEIVCGTGIVWSETFRVRADKTTKVYYTNYEFILE